MSKRIRHLNILSMTTVVCLFFGCQENPKPIKKSSVCQQQPNTIASTGTNTNSGTSGYNMIGGQVTNEFPGVVLLININNGRINSCSGTVVGPNTVFTAAHCFASGDEKATRIYTRSFPSTPYVDQYPQSEYIVKQVFKAAVPSTFIEADTGRITNSGIAATRDFAIIITQNSFPNSMIQSLNDNLTTQVKEEFQATVVGYGIDESGKSGTKRKGNVVMQEFIVPEFPSQTVFQQSRGQSSQAEVQSGDSGGALIYDNQLVGVLIANGNSVLSLKSDAAQELIKQAKSAGAILGQGVQQNAVANQNTIGQQQQPYSNSANVSRSSQQNCLN